MRVRLTVIADQYGARSGNLQRDDLVVAGLGRAAAVAVRGRDPEAPTRGPDHRPQPPEPPFEQADLGTEPGPVDAHPPQRLATQRGHVEPAVDDRVAARRGLGGRPGHLRVDEAPALRGAAALDDRPPVVPPRADEVDLVDVVLPELGGPQPAAAVPGQALRGAVTVAPDGRAPERVAPGNRAVRIEAQDLPVARAPGLGQARVARLADRD